MELGTFDSVLVAQIALDSKAGSPAQVLSYKTVVPLSPGEAVIVPVGTRESLGFVVECSLHTSESLGLPIESLRSIVETVSGLSLPAKSIELATYIAESTLSSMPQALSIAVPGGARERLITSWILNDPEFDPKTKGFQLERQDTRSLPPLQKETLRVLRDEGGTITEVKVKGLSPSILKALLQLQKIGLVKRELRYQPVTERRGGTQFLQLTSDKAKIEKFLSSESKKKPAQALVILRLQESENISGFTVGEIKALAGVTDATIRALMTEKVLVESKDEKNHVPSVAPQPNKYQKLAIESICEAIETKNPEPFLLFGITGSGKTEVYLRATAEALRHGRQVLYLVPEIALATQAIARLRERYGEAVAVLHSELTATERLRSFQRIRSREAAIVLGARSGLFAPFEDLGLVIIDEEHETSYKQDSSPRYYSHNVALKLAELHKCPVVFGSATPSIESFFAAEQGEYTLLSLPERAAEAKLPEVFIDDLTLGFRINRPAIIGDPLRIRLEKTLQAGNQVILFLNRRAYAPFLLCRDCGWRCPCPNCSVTLSFHRYEMMLRCHHCSYSQIPPDECPKCMGRRITPLGVGTEKVEEAVKELFPEARIGRLDRDIAAKKGQLEQALANFRSGETQILVGTQMVAKGLDFPNVTLVGVIAADVSLNLPDFRASERTFQLLSQVAGRAGRGQKAGEVVIQTFNPDHPSVIFAQTHDYIKFYESMLVERKEAGYPPYQRLVNVLFSSPSRPAVVLATERFVDHVVGIPGIELCGPVDCVLERIREQWRRHILIKLPAKTSPKSLGDHIKTFHPQNCQMIIDVDPFSMM